MLRKRRDTELEQVFSKFPEVFCQGLTMAGQCTAGEGEIELIDERPAYSQLFPMPAKMKEELQEYVEDMLKKR